MPIHHHCNWRLMTVGNLGLSVFLLQRYNAADCLAVHLHNAAILYVQKSFSEVMADSKQHDRLSEQVCYY